MWCATERGSCAASHQGPVGQRLTPAVAVLLHGPHGALVVAPGQLLPNHLQLPEAPVGEVGPAQLEGGTRRLEGRARLREVLMSRLSSEDLERPPTFSGNTASTWHKSPGKGRLCWDRAQICGPRCRLWVRQQPLPSGWRTCSGARGAPPTGWSSRSRRPTLCSRCPIRADLPVT